MVRYTPQQRGAIALMYARNNNSIIATQRAFRRKFPGQQAPTAQTIRRLVARIEEEGITSDRRRTGRNRTSRSLENIERISESVQETPRTSLRRRSAQLEIPVTSLRRIMHSDLHLFPYKIQLVQSLHPADLQTRLTYCEMILNLNNEIHDFHSKLLMTDEAHFELNGTVNKQNCRFWGETNPRETHSRPLHPQRVTIWCGMTSQFIIGPYFFEDSEENVTTVNGERYREMIQEFLVPELNKLGLENMWFQQDGATAHTAPNRLIPRYGDFNWPARSPDLTAPDFYLWGYLKSKVYINKPVTLQHLKENIRAEIAAITQETLARVMENALEKARICQHSNGGH